MIRPRFFVLLLPAWLTLASPVAAAPMAEPIEMTLQVVGVHRPVDLQGRTVQTPREVYLRSPPEQTMTLDALIGKVLTVHRTAPAPGALPKPDAGIVALEIQIGRIEVIAVRDAVAIARVIEDGIHTDAPAVPGVELPAVMVGDVARFTPPPPPPPAPPALSAAEVDRLEADRKRLEQADAVRRAKPQPYRRKVMRWEL